MGNATATLHKSRQGESLRSGETLIARWRRVQGLSFRELGDRLGVKRQTAQRYCLPPGDDNHRRPDPAPAAALRKATGGEITIANYADPAGPAPKRGRR
jgi:hypothetical protein